MPSTTLELTEDFLEEAHLASVASEDVDFRLLSACAATVRKSLQGLDYITADGTKGFEDLCVIVESLKE